MKTPILKPLTLAIMATSLTGCLSSSSDGESGTLSLGITDAPVDDLQKVKISYTGVTLKPANGNRVEIDFDEPKNLDMLELQRGNAASLLEDEEVPAGEYNFIRLKVKEGDDMFVETLEGGEEPLTVQSEELKLVSGFTVPQGGEADFTIDFDMRKAITEPDGQDGFFLRPALRLVDNTEVGAIEGIVDGTFAKGECDDVQAYAGAAYVYEGADADLVDLNSNAEKEPLMATPVDTTDDSNELSYKAAFLTEGTYTISYSCSMDDPDADDDLTFAETRNVDVTADTTEEENFGTGDK
ncbi:uncharacterized protein DUF4382 [Halospina denitrificans]|uniref:Uncharacterized protein DUF4382 n=1 Tax=Halospina denitrificans TaxID=332522 RepID=A0A4R7K3L5_9GAMM|nr:DUF4382 domain-containing protein [Halospina denitrificans]TDT44603.1 uncharacterized protein DUF4382 [Halospina denitrificans]